MRGFPILNLYPIACRYQRPRGLRSYFEAARLLRLWVGIPPGVWLLICCECCVLQGRGLCDELITRPEESYRLWCVVVCALETSWMRRILDRTQRLTTVSRTPLDEEGCRAKNKTKNSIAYQKKYFRIQFVPENVYESRNFRNSRNRLML